MIEQTLPAPSSRRIIYFLDAAFAGVAGIVLAGAAGPLTGLLGWAFAPSFLTALGVLLLPWAAFNAWSGSQAKLPGWANGVHIAGDAGWVIASAGILIWQSGSLSGIGALLLFAQMLIVAGVFLLKRRARQG